MKIDLKDYMEERDKIRDLNRAADGPVLTVSREFGCQVNRIIQLLLFEINELGPGPVKKHPWKYINKEVLEESARELGLKPREIEDRIQWHHSDTVNDILTSFSHHYTVTDKLIINKVKEVVDTYSKKGNVIIVGRAGSALTEGFNNVLKIRFIAPFEWRVENFAQKMKIDVHKARDLVGYLDKQRREWIEHISGRLFNLTDYDLVLNVKTLKDREMIQLILELMKRREMIKSVAQKLSVS